MKVLITGGATREPIDGVRFITNFSTGRTGAALAELFQQNGCEVTYLAGAGSVMPDSSVGTFEFSSFDSLRSLLADSLKGRAFDLVVHLAAIGDFSVEGAEINGSYLSAKELLAAGKLKSCSQMTLKMKQNCKLVDELRAMAGDAELKVVAFKLTNRASAADRSLAIAKLFGSSRADFVVHNDLTEIDAAPEGVTTAGSALPVRSVKTAGANRSRHLFQVYARPVKALVPQTKLTCENVDDLGYSLLKLLGVESRGEFRL